MFLTWLVADQRMVLIEFAVIRSGLPDMLFSFFQGNVCFLFLATTTISGKPWFHVQSLPGFLSGKNTFFFVIPMWNQLLPLS